MQNNNKLIQNVTRYCMFVNLWGLEYHPSPEGVGVCGELSGVAEAGQIRLC